MPDDAPQTGQRYGTPIGDTGFVASSPSDRAHWLYDTIREFRTEVERVLDSDKVGHREGWSIVKNEPYEQAFLRMVAKLLIADRDRLALTPPEPKEGGAT